MPAATPRLLLIDGHSVAYRAFYALPAENFSAGGQHTNAVYGFTAMLINLLRDEKPTHIAVAFDVSRKSFRTERYVEYKANRSESPQEFKGQVELIGQVLEALHIPSFAVEGFEADDVIATLATAAQGADMEVLICTGDRDAFQLVTDTTTILYPKRGVSDLVRFTPEEVQTKYGVRPEQYRILAALVGETSDNLPGIPGVGPKTAAKWINTYDSLSSLVENAGSIKGKVGDALRENLPQVELNWQLNGLVRDMDLPTAVDDLVWKGWEREKVHEVFDALQFRVLRIRLAETLPGAEALPEGVTRQADQTQTVDSTSLVKTATVLEPGAVASWLEQHSTTHPLGVAVEGKWAQGSGSVEALALSTVDGEAGIILVSRLTPDDDAALAAWMSDQNRPKFAHDIKGPLLAIMAHGWQMAGVEMDTALAAYLLHPDQRGYDLGDLSLRYLGRQLDAVVSSSGQLTLDGLDEADDHQPLAEKAATVAQLAVVLREKLEDIGGSALLADVELPLVDVLVAMERIGIAADAGQLAELQVRFDADAVTAAKAAHAAAGREFNLGSPKQVQAVLFDELGLPKTKKIKTGYTTDAESLTKLLTQTGHPVVEQLLRHRDVARLGSIVEGLTKATADDGRIHTTFHQTVAATGRLSSTDPNLQNIPIRTAEGRLIREVFIPGKGFEALMSADYSQIDLRVLAHMSEDKGLTQAFMSTEDLHKSIAAQVFGVPIGEVTPDHRRRIKAVAYGLAYGLSSYGLAQQLGIDPEEARELSEEFFTRFDAVKGYLKGLVDVARREGYTETVLGRRRFLPDLTSDNRQRREMAERMALNAPIQGSSADIMKLAMLRVDTALAKEGLHSRVLLQVHDELVLEVAEGEQTALTALVRREMSGAYALRVPLDVSIGIGPQWDAAAH